MSLAANSRRVGLVGFGIAILVAIRLLASGGWDPASFIKFGELEPERTEYGQRWLGEDLILAPELGHDGRFFFMQAMDPFYLQPQDHAAYLDRPSYRAQRMLYPTIASLGGLLGPRAIAWSLIGVNILAMALGTYFTARLAQQMGGSAWLGLAFTLNPGLVSELQIDGGGVMATAALMAGAWALLRGQTGWAVAALTAASLAREVMILAPLGLFVYLIWRYRKLAHWSFVVPFVVVGAWWLYVHARLDDGLTQDLQAVDLPFRGFLQAFEGWMTTPGRAVDMAVGVLLLLISLVVLYRVKSRPSILAAGVAGMAALTLTLSEPVWSRYFDSFRAAAPVVTAFVVLTFSREGDVGPASSEETSLVDTTATRAPAAD